jgi:hypothetical protein
MTNLRQLAAASVAALNAQTFRLPFVAVRKHLATVRLDDHAALGVYVWAARKRLDRDTFNGWGREYDLQVALYQKPETLTDDAIDAFEALAEEVLDFLAGQVPDGCTCTQAEFSADDGRALHLEELEQHAALCSVITATYREE